MNLIADLSTIPVASLITIFLGVFLLVFLGALVIRYLGIQSIGPIKREQESYSTVHQMNSINEEYDNSLQARLRDYTDEQRVSLVNTLLELSDNEFLRRALSAAIRFPMYKSINNNHFTRVFLPDRIKEYKERILRQLKNEYIDLHQVSLRSEHPLKSWEEGGSELITKFFNDWLKTALMYTTETCEDKIANYKEYKDKIASKYWSDMVESKIEKNQYYVKMFKGVIDGS